MFGSGVRNGRGESGGFLKESVILCPANRQPGGIHEWRVRRARADIVLSEVRQALSRPVWRNQGVSRSNLSALPRGEQGRCVRVPSADEADAATDSGKMRAHELRSLLIILRVGAHKGPRLDYESKLEIHPFGQWTFWQLADVLASDAYRTSQCGLISLIEGNSLLFGQGLISHD